MRNRSVAASMRKSIVSAVALAGLNVLTILYSVEPAAAGFLSSVQSSARRGETCGDRHAACSRRCIDKYDTGGEAGRAAAFRCVQRTCDKQHENCKKETGQSDGTGTHAPPSRDIRPRHPFQIPAGGILNNMPGLPSQGPSATGSPLGGSTAPSAPPVILR